MSHLLIRLGSILLFLLFGGEHPQLPHDPEQALQAAGIASLPQPEPQLHHAKRGIPSVHIPDQLQFSFCVLIGMAVGFAGLAGQGCRTSIPACFPEVDIGPAFVVSPAGSADAIFLCVLH